MKKVSITLACCCIILFACAAFGCNVQTQYFRLHIRANSNSAVDQEVKYEVRDAVVEYLTPHLAKCASKEGAIAVIKNHESAVKRLIEAVLIKNGFKYGCKLTIVNESFPTRVYDGVTLEAGYYDALIIELGEGVGDNWWCVVYPPLCFVGNEDISYRFKIFDIINGL